jgi:hypothetical protein
MTELSMAQKYLMEADAAFPTTLYDGGERATSTGLSKRELFAAMAFHGYISRSDLIDLGAHDRARWSVKAADALIAALEGDAK